MSRPSVRRPDCRSRAPGGTSSPARPTVREGTKVGPVRAHREDVGGRTGANREGDQQTGGTEVGRGSGHMKTIWQRPLRPIRREQRWLTDILTRLGATGDAAYVEPTTGDDFVEKLAFWLENPEREGMPTI